METNSLTETGNLTRFQLEEIPSLTKSGNYKKKSVKKISDDGEHDSLIERPFIFIIKEIFGQRNQEKKRARILKKVEKLFKNSLKKTKKSCSRGG